MKTLRKMDHAQISHKTENNQCDENMLEEGTDALCCNIKQEEIEDEFCGIIEGFLDNTDADMRRLENENQMLMQENHVEDLHSQVSRCR